MGGSPAVGDALRHHLESGQGVATSAHAWFEFLCGPARTGVTDEEVDAIQVLVQGHIISMDSTIASISARLFNQIGRARGSQGDCIIAATALFHDAELFTLNESDFLRFTPFGLRLYRAS